METYDLYININELGRHNSKWNRLKTWLWNFILPPHIRLSIKEPTSKEKENNE